MTDPDETAGRRLRRIADLLDIPVARLFADPPPGERVETDDLLRLCHSLKTEAGRAAALAALRSIRDREEP